jgi:hypothetical protein
MANPIAKFLPAVLGGNPEGKKKKPSKRGWGDPITPEERSHFIRRLLYLSEHLGRNPTGLRAAVQAVIDGHSMFSPLRPQLEGIQPPARREGNNARREGSQAAKRFEREMNDLIETAIQLVDSQPMHIPEESLRLQVDAYMNKWLWRVGVPGVLAIFVGGTLFGYHVEGLAARAESASKAAMERIGKSVDDAERDAAKIKVMSNVADGQIGTLNGTVVQLRKDLDQRSGEMSSLSAQIRTSGQDTEAIRNSMTALNRQWAESKQRIDQAKTVIDASAEDLGIFAKLPKPAQDAALQATISVAGARAEFFFSSLVISFLAIGFSIATAIRLRRLRQSLKSGV